MYDDLKGEEDGNFGVFVCVAHRSTVAETNLFDLNEEHIYKFAAGLRVQRWQDTSVHTPCIKMLLSKGGFERTVCASLIYLYVIAIGRNVCAWSSNGKNR